MPKKEIEPAVEKTKTETAETKSAVETFAVPSAVTEALEKVKKDAVGKTSSVFEEPPKEAGEEEVEKTGSEKPPETPQETSLEGAPGGEEVSEEIDPRLVDAAHAADLTDEEIERFATNDWNLFVKTFTPKVKPVEKEVIPPVGETKPLSKIKLDAETTQKWVDAYGQDAVDSAIKPLAETLNATIDQLNEVRTGLGKVQGRFTEQDKQDEGRRQALKLQDANKVFDEESKNYPELGLTGKMTKTDDGRYATTSAEFRTRSEIYGIAEVFNATGVSWPTSLKQALTWYAGKVGEKRAEQRLIADINKDKKRWVARPDHKKVEREFASPNEAKKAIMQEAYKKAGVVA